MERSEGLNGEEAREKAMKEMKDFVDDVRGVVEEMERGIEERGINDPTRV